MGSEITNATHNDLISIVGLAKQFWKESENDLPFNPVHFSVFVSDAILKENHFVKVFKKDNIVVGVIIGMIEDWIGAPVLKAQEVIWYVNKKHRGSPSSIKLLKSYLDWAKGKNAALIFCGAYKGRARPIYEKLGLVMADEVWVMK
jgi:RimJ/RimL family protein N-acetyltransferase